MSIAFFQHPLETIHDLLCVGVWVGAILMLGTAIYALGPRPRK